MKQILIAMLAAALLAACSSTPKQEPVTTREAGSGTPPVPAVPPPDTGTVVPVTPPVGGDFEPLKDFSIYFDLDEYTVSEKYIAVVRRHADYMKKNPAQKASVQGNTDERGSREYNLSLGQKRAEAVKKMLVQEGVKDAQIEAVSLGEEKPKNPGHDEAAWAENRRSDITYPR